jgi:hypothetical protein
LPLPLQTAFSSGLTIRNDDGSFGNATAGKLESNVVCRIDFLEKLDIASYPPPRKTDSQDSLIKFHRID